MGGMRRVEAEVREREAESERVKAELSMMLTEMKGKEEVLR